MRISASAAATSHEPETNAEYNSLNHIPAGGYHGPRLVGNKHTIYSVKQARPDCECQLVSLTKDHHNRGCSLRVSTLNKIRYVCNV